eukprot:363841-Chlamydomonas_euryale.AAC.10
MLYRIYVVPALLYAVPETSGLTDHQLQPLVSAHNANLDRITGMGGRPDGTPHQTAQVCAAAGVTQLMHVLNAAQFTRIGHVTRMPDESMVKQLLFPEGLVGLEGMVGRPRSTCRDRALTALRPVLTSRLVGWGWYGVAQHRTQWRTLCDSVLPAAESPLPCYAQHRHTLRGSAPC